MYLHCVGASHPTEPKRQGARPRLIERRQLLVLLATSVPSFMMQLDANIVSVSLPSIAHSLHASFSGIEWVVSAYMLAFATLLMPAGALADRYGRKPLLILGLLVFTAASLACGLATNLATLVAARTLQGVGAALQLSAALATLSYAIQGPARGPAFAFWGSVVGLGIALGPVVGGVITQSFGWQWAFFVNIPIAVPLLLLIVRHAPASRDPLATRLDLPGVATFAGFLFLTTLALISANHEGWGSIAILSELGAAVLLLAAFVLVELHQARPMLELRFFRNSTFLGGTIAQFGFAACLLTLLTYLPIYLQGALGYSSSRAGLMMLPMVVPVFFVPRLTTRHLAHRFSGRTLLAAGLMLGALGLALLMLEVAKLRYDGLIAGLILCGMGAGLLNGETTKVAMSAIPAERSGMASGVSGSVRFMGIVLGVASLGAVLFARTSAVIDASLPDVDAVRRTEFIRDIVAGNLSGGGIASGLNLHLLALHAFAEGFRMLLFAAACAALCATLLTWRLVRAADTAPVAAARTAPGSDRS
jgi:EmrB/QacA subfamily drug resistance transporter